MRTVRARMLTLCAFGLATLLTACGGGNAGSGDFLNNPVRPVGVVVGQVTSSVDGSPIPNAVLLIESVPQQVGGLVEAGGTLAFRVGTLADGRYTALNTPVGALTLNAGAPGFRFSSPKFRSLATNGTITVDFVLSPGDGNDPDGKTFDFEDGDGRNAYPWNYDGNFFSDRPGGG